MTSKGFQRPRTDVVPKEKDWGKRTNLCWRLHVNECNAQREYVKTSNEPMLMMKKVKNSWQKQWGKRSIKRTLNIKKRRTGRVKASRQNCPSQLLIFQILCHGYGWHQVLQKRTMKQSYCCSGSRSMNQLDKGQCWKHRLLPCAEYAMWHTASRCEQLVEYVIKSDMILKLLGYIENCTANKTSRFAKTGMSKSHQSSLKTTSKLKHKRPDTFTELKNPWKRLLI